MDPEGCNSNLFTSPAKSGATHHPSFAEVLENYKTHVLSLLSQVNVQNEYLSGLMPASVTWHKLAPLLRVRKFFIQFIISLESTPIHDAIKAEILYDRLVSLYKSYMSNEIEIASLIEGVTLDTHLKYAEKVQQNVIHFELCLKKVMLKKSPSLVASRANDRPERMKRSDSDDMDKLYTALELNKFAIEQNEAKKLKLLETERMDCSKSNFDPVLTKTVQKDADLPSAPILGLEKSSSIAPSLKKATEEILNQEIEQHKLNELGFEIIQPPVESMELSEEPKEPENVQPNLPNDQIKAVKSNEKSNTPEAIQQQLSLEPVQPIKSNNEPFKLDGILENRPFLQIEPVKDNDKAGIPPETVQLQQNLSAEQIEPLKTIDKSPPVQAAQLDELANKTETLTLNDTTSKPSEKNDQTTPTENIDEIIDKCFEKQTYLMRKIKLVKLTDVNSEDEIEIRADYLSYLQESFVSNQNELEKYLNPFTRKQQQNHSKDVLKTLSDIQFRLEHRKHFG